MIVKSHTVLNAKMEIGKAVHTQEICLVTVTDTAVLADLTPFAVRFPDVPTMAQSYPDMGQPDKEIFVVPESPAHSNDPNGGIDLNPSGANQGPGMDTATPYQNITQYVYIPHSFCRIVQIGTCLQLCV